MTHRRILILMLIAAIFVMGVGAASEVTLTLEGITANPLPNNAMDVYVAGNYAYVADYTNGLVIVDISDPANPTTVGNYPSRVGDYGYTAAAIGVAASGNYVYVANWYDDLYIIDVTDKTNPTLANTYAIADGADSITISGDLAFIAAAFAGVDIIDISDPVNPVFIGNYNTNDLAEDVAIQNNYAYIADRDDGVIIIDISDPANPYLVGSIDTPYDANSIVVSGTYAYVADADDTLIIDISNPAAPAIVGQYDTTDSWGIVYDGNYVYVGDGGNGVVVLNVNDPTNPILAGGFDTAGYAMGLTIVGNLVYVADGPFVILRTDASGTSAPPDDMKFGYIENYIMSNIIDLKVAGNHLYVTNGSNFNVFNINSNGLLSHVYTIENLIGDIAISGDYAYISGANLTIVDITNPESPSIVGNYLGAEGRAIVVSGDYAYVAKYRNDLLVFDISDKTNPLLIGSCYVRQISDIAVSGNYVYATDLDNLVLIDVSDPTSPSVVKSYSLPGAPRTIAFSNNYIYLPSFFYGLVVFDVNDPLSAFITGVNEIPVNAHHIVVSGNYAYIANSLDGASFSQTNDVTIINVSNPSAPLYVGNYTKGPMPSTSGVGTIWDLAVSDDYIYVNDVVEGLVILGKDVMTTGSVYNINKGTDYTTIQAAIDAASSGDEIHVDSGTYYENVNVDKQLTLRGIDTGAGMPVVDAGGSGNVITISVDKSLVEGFIIQNSGLLDVNAGMIITSNDNVIKNNEVTSNKAGISLESSSNNIVEGNIVNFNSYPGIALTSANNNIISNNEVNSNAYYGIELYLSSNNIVIDNIANSNTRYGIFVWQSHNDNRLISNTANNNVNAGIRFYTSSNNNVSNNLFDSNNYGISIYGSGGNVISENTISFNENGIFFDSSSNNVIYHNNITQNTHQASDNSGPNAWYDAYPSGGNYWSDYIHEDTKSGPNQDQSGSDGIGDTPYPIPGGSSVDRYPLMAVYTPPTNTEIAKILFQSMRDGNEEIYVMDEDGSNQIRLTQNTASDGYPVWSPDNQKIAFVSNRNGDWEIFSMNTLDNLQTNLTRNPANDGYPSWSPDSQKIVFASDRDSPIPNLLDIHVMSADGTNVIRLTNNPAEDVHPAWSSDGQKIAFASDREGNREIYVMNIDGTNVINLTNYGAAYDDYPAWSPDGTKIAFASDRDSHDSTKLDIYLMDANGDNVIRLTENLVDDRHPAWSSDGSKIAFASNRDGNRDIYVMKPDGTEEVTRLTNQPGDDQHPSFSPATSEPTITIISPIGGEEWQASTTQTIQWSYTGNLGPGVEIEIFNSSGPVQTFTYVSIGSDGSGSYQWLIPENLAYGTDYQVKITVIGSAYSDASGHFTISAPSSGFTIGQGAPNSTVEQLFIAAYDRNGGVGVLGEPESDVHEAFGLYPVQNFLGVPGIHGGVLMYNSIQNNVSYIHGAIWERYYIFQDKAELGPVKEDEKDAAPSQQGTTGRHSKFETGTIHWISDETGENENDPNRGKSFVTYGDLDKLYTDMGGTYNNWLGFPIMDQEVRDGHGYCEFEGGYIEWDDVGGAYIAEKFEVGQGVINNEIRDAFVAAYIQNGEEAVLGKPETLVYADSSGYYVQEFPGVPGIPGGVLMYNSNSKAAFYIHGAIWEKYNNYPDKAKLGPVKEDEKDAAPSQQGTTGRYSKFENGTIHWIGDENVDHPQKGESFVTHGELDVLYASMGGTYNNYLGFPVMDQEERDGREYCKFEGGNIFVKQKLKLLVVPVGHTGMITSEDNTRIRKIANDTRDFYLKSSYGAIYLDFDFEQPVSLSSDVNLGDAKILTKNTLSQLSVDYSKYDTVIIVDDFAGVQHQAYPPKIVEDIMKPASAPIITVAIVPIEGQEQFGIWVHEIGHTLGYTVQTSDMPKDPEALLWGKLNTPNCCDLYKYGDVGGWDVMATGVYVYDSNGNNGINQPIDMSVLSKTKLGWLNTNSIVGISGDYNVMSTENMHYGDFSFSYKPTDSNEVEYFIEARELTQPSFYEWPSNKFHALNNGIVIYKKSYDSTGKYSINILRSALDFSSGPTLLASDGTSASYSDCGRFVKFSVSASNPNPPYNAVVQIGEPGTLCKAKGGVILVVDKITSIIPSDWFPSGNILTTLPDLDLHAYTPDGKHVGINYASGEYEVQIPGAVASGDLINGEEWIFVSKDVEVKYYVDSHDAQKYLEENPDINAENAIMEYSTFLIEYGENPQSEQLPDGTRVVRDKIVFESQIKAIGPGEVKKIIINIYNITFLPPITTMDQYTLKAGSTFPIKFTARNSTTDEFTNDDTINVTITNSTGHLITYFTNGTGTDSVKINPDEEEQYIVSFDTKNYGMNVGETYAITVTFGKSDSLKGYEVAYFTLVDGDTTPPSSISNLSNIAGTTWIMWNWTNPTDSDFNHTEIYLNGVLQTQTTAESFSANGLDPGADYTLLTCTVDTSGNMGTWFGLSSTTSKPVNAVGSCRSCKTS